MNSMQQFAAIVVLPVSTIPTKISNTGAYTHQQCNCFIYDLCGLCDRDFYTWGREVEFKMRSGCTYRRFAKHREANTRKRFEKISQWCIFLIHLNMK